MINNSRGVGKSKLCSVVCISDVRAVCPSWVVVFVVEVIELLVMVEVIDQASVDLSWWR